MQVKKVIIKDKKVSISMIKGNGDILDLTSPNRKPTPEFLADLQALAEDVIDACDFGASEKVEDFTVTGVSFSYKKKKVGVIITSSRKCVNGAITINTPLMYLDGSKETGYSEKAVDRICAIQKHGEEFAEGKDAQGKLFKNDGKAAAAGETPDEETPDEVEQDEAA